MSRYIGREAALWGAEGPPLALRGCHPGPRSGPFGAEGPQFALVKVILGREAALFRDPGAPLALNGSYLNVSRLLI